MQLYYFPGACSLAIHILLEEIGAPYQLHAVNLRAGEQNSAEFRAQNPKGKVPALVRDDGSVLTELPAIAFWLSRRFPQAGLLGDDLETQARALELIDFVVSTIHMRGYTLTVAPQRFVSEPAAQEEVRAAGRKVFTDGLAVLGERLGTQDWFLGNYSVADAVAFFVINWATKNGTELPENLQRFHARMLARPAVAAAVAQEAG